MKISGEEARSIVYSDHENFQLVENNIVDNTRWSIVHEGVVKHLPSCKYYSIGWRVGATEMQEESPFEYEDEVELIEVHSIEKVVKVWEAITP